ncbi:hypothetical protein GOV14_04400 [Candidatus Pacearchaeota archaeon]|nr:hypothetical protein [Candidatus Pacearchaeota archaeon]
MIYKKSVMIILIVVICITPITALGLTPAKVIAHYYPGGYMSMTYTTLSTQPDYVYRIYADGDFSKSVQFDKTSITGGGGFLMNLTFPDTAPKYGENLLYIHITENKRKSSGFSTIVNVGALIKILVPYPGRYAEIEGFGVQTVNEGMKSDIGMEVINRGEENLEVSPLVELYSSGELIHKVVFDKTFINNRSFKEFKATIDTTDFPPGPYEAYAYVDYGGGIANATFDFLIGTLFVDVINWTKKVPTGGLSPYLVEVESKWNNNIDRIYAMVNITNETGEVASFKTSPTDLPNWQKDTVSAYVDVENVNPGIYDAKIVLIYEDVNTTKDSFLEVYALEQPFFTKKVIITLSIVGGVLVLILLNVLLYVFLLRRKNKNGQN